MRDPTEGRPRGGRGNGGRRGSNRGADPERNGFTCIRCRAPVSGVSFGTSNRNHCPRCLWSRHVDDRELGDRMSCCRAAMEPLAVSAPEDKQGEWVIVHRCTSCGVLRVNRIAGDDDEVALLRLALRPLAMPAFPLDGFRVGEGPGVGRGGW